MSEIYLGVDAGGTKTVFALGDATHELARVRVGTIKRLKVDAATAEAHLLEGLRALEVATGIAPRAVRRCCVGLAGDSVPLVADWVRAAFAQHVGGELVVLSDVVIALDAAFHGGRGVLVLAGTGSNVAARTASGAVFTVGGWGPALADQGSGHFLGLEGLRRGFLALDEERPTRLLDDAQAFWGLGSREALIEFANTNPAPEFSGLAPVVVAAAAAGDAVAQEVLAQAGADLAMLAGLAIERMRRLDGAERFVAPEVAITSSILEQVVPVRASLESHLRARYAGIGFVAEPADPPAGALWRARRGRS